MMNNPVVILILAALLLAKICFLLNFYLLSGVFWLKRIQKRPDMTLIFSRFAVDMLYAVTNIASLAYLLIRGIFPDFVIKNLSFFIIWPYLNIGTIRLLLVIFLAADRIFASCLPILYHKHRSKVSNLALLAVILSYTLFEQFILFKICNFVLDVPLSCLQLTCSVNACYRDYWLYFEQIGYFVLGALSLVICFRLFIWTRFMKTNHNEEISRTTKITLLDAFIIFSFDVLPKFLFVFFPEINFQSVGPLSALCKNFGFVIESMIICKVLMGKKMVTVLSINRFPVNET